MVFIRPVYEFDYQREKLTAGYEGKIVITKIVATKKQGDL